LQEIPAYTAPVSVLVSAPVSAWLHRRLRGRIAVASPSHHRRIALAPHSVAARNAGDLPTSLELHMPVVQPTRCTRTEEVEPQQLAMGEAMMRTHDEVIVERLLLDDSSKSYAVHHPMRSIELKHCTAQSTQKTQTIKP
jgi:hypothetical protein